MELDARFIEALRVGSAELRQNPPDSDMQAADQARCRALVDVLARVAAQHGVRDRALAPLVADQVDGLLRQLVVHGDPWATRFCSELLVAEIEDVLRDILEDVAQRADGP